MGRSGSTSNDHRSKGTKFCMEKYYLQVRDTQDDHLRKWSPIQQPRIQVILREPKHQKQVFVLRTSLGQWKDRSNKPNLTKDHQDPISGGKGSMAQGVTKHPMGLQDYSMNANRRDALQSNLRNSCSHLG